MEAHVLLDMGEASFEGIGSIGNVEAGMAEVGEEEWKVSFHAVVRTPKSTVRIVPPSRDLIDRSLLEKRYPLVVPEFQPERELFLADLRKESHQCLNVLSRFEHRPPRHVPRDDGGLMKMAHLHWDGKASQQATPSITDNRLHLPADSLQKANPVLVCLDRFVWKKLPQEVLAAVRTAPNHDTEEVFEICGVHDNDHLIRCKLLPLNLHSLQLPLHPFRAASELPGNLFVGLFAVRELLPNLFLLGWRFLTELFPTLSTSPELSTLVRPILLDRA